MRLSSALFTSALACLVSSAIAREIPIAGRYALEARQNRNGNNGGNRNGGGRNGGGGGGGRASSTSSAAPAATSGTGRGGNNGGNNGGGNGGGNPATSLTLDPSVINSNFASTGQEGGGDPGQVASLTSTNNFINFCVGKTLTNGQQVRGGSCNATPMGDLPSTSRMPSGKFVSPKNLDTLQPNTAFTVQLAVKNMATGNFVNPQTNYFAAPQQLNGQGTIVAHSHVVIEQIDSLTSTTATDPTKFAFFQGLNAPAQGGVLSATVTNGLPAGVYRISSINTSANHAPVVGPVAQHGSFDDAIYITVGGGRGGNGGGNGGGKKNKLARRFPSREGKARL